MDDEDFEELSKYRWKLMGTPGRYYAARTVYMHKQVAGSDCVVDHANRDTLDNRKVNLRVACLKRNNWNTGKRAGRCGKPSTSKYKGVCRPTGSKKWMSKIVKDGKKYALGFFDNELDAARAYDEAAKRLFGEFAFLNGV